MHAKILKYLADIRASYWFIPSLMAISAVIMSFVLTAVDGRLGSKWLHSVSWLYANQPSGARAVLSTIAGSMITVAGVTFSMTIVAVSYATGQLGPRLINNFMRDRSNQVTLGVFIGTFIYCLLVLRTVRDSNGLSADSVEAIGAFVPHLAILFALFSALVSVAVLIYYIHHIPESINVSNLTARVGREMNDMIDELFPAKLGTATTKDDLLAASAIMPEDFYASAVAIKSDYDGYIQVLDEGALLEVATKNDLIIRVEYRPGDFVTAGKALVLVWPPDKFDSAVSNACQNAFAFGDERTPAQNILFLVEQLVEIIARALSPGINDPFTAVSSIDWLQAMLSKMVDRESPSSFRSDENGSLRVIVHPLTFERALNSILNQIRPYICKDRIATLRVIKMIAEIAIDLPADSKRQKLLLEHATALNTAARQSMTLDTDRNEVQKQHDNIYRMLDDPEFRNKMRDDVSWLEGTA